MSVLRKGDTLIEVMLSISIFAFVALLAINMMNDGMNTAQRTLEATMARNEMAAQADALRYVHNGYVSQFQGKGGFTGIWSQIENRMITAGSSVNDDNDFNVNNIDNCSEVYNDGTSNPPIKKYKAFILNPRLLLPEYVGGKNVTKYLGKDYSDISNLAINTSNLSETDLYPRLRYEAIVNDGSEPDDNLKEENGYLYMSLASADGIWINGVRESSATSSSYYDFYVRTCWQAAGVRAPSTITTIVRLYNPRGV